MKSPLKVELKDGKLIISIGVETLSQVVELYGYKITNCEKFAKDVVKELLDEQDEGTTMVHEMLDMAANQAVDNGSKWAEENTEENE